MANRTIASKTFATRLGDISVSMVRVVTGMKFVDNYYRVYVGGCDPFAFYNPVLAKRFYREAVRDNERLLG